MLQNNIRDDVFDGIYSSSPFAYDISNMHVRINKAPALSVED